MLALYLSSVDQTKHAADILLTFQAAGLVLRTVALELFQRLRKGQLHDLGAFHSKQLSLIVAALFAVFFMHRYAGDEVEALVLNDAEDSLHDLRCQRLYEVGAVVKLHSAYSGGIFVRIGEGCRADMSAVGIALEKDIGKLRRAVAAGDVVLLDDPVAVRTANRIERIADAFLQKFAQLHVSRS